MNLDEFAFFNQQLAAMLRDGIPLEGALRQLSAGMRRGRLRDELQRLEADLVRGTPLTDALSARRLPDIYKRMLLAGAKSNDLPSMLALLADYYQSQHTLWTKLKGLMVYPIIVLFAAFAVSCIFYFVWGRIFQTVGAVPRGQSYDEYCYENRMPAMVRAALPLLDNLWIFPTLFGFLFAFTLVLVSWPSTRRAARWRFPAFRESSLAQTASTFWLLLKGGLPFPDAIALVEQFEADPKTRRDLAAWKEKLAAGVTKFSAVAADAKRFPKLFAWLVSSAGEDMAAGFKRAAEIYQARATQRSEILLYAALPVMVLVLGVVILTQGWLLISGALGSFATWLGV